MGSKLVELRNELNAKQKKLADVLKEAGPENDFSKVITLEGDDTASKVQDFRKKSKELDDLAEKIKAEVELENAIKSVNGHGEKAGEFVHSTPRGEQAPREYKSLGRLVSEHPDIKAISKAHRGEMTLDIEFKTVMTTSAGFAPESLRTGEVVPYVRRPTSVLDLVPMGRTSYDTIKYMEQTTRTNTSTEMTESTDTTVDATLAYTERSQTVELVGVSLPVTMQQLEDVPQVESIINTELIAMERERVDYQLLNGSGSTPYLQGILNKTGIQSAVAAGDRLDAMYGMIKDIRVTGRSTADNFVMHPNDWQRIRLARTDDGLYILGNPNEALVRVWGLPVTETDAIAEQTVLCGAFNPWSMLYEKRGALVEMSDSHSTNFMYFKYLLRASWRLAFVIKRPAAFKKLTAF